MITLYAKTGCSYCAKAISALDAHGLSFTKKNIAEEGMREELAGLGGKEQVPYLIDGETKMYESDAIVAYIEKTYGNGAGVIPASHVNVYKAQGGACPS